MKKNITSLYISHGGGPLPLLGDPSHHEMLTCLQKIASEIPKPSAIVLVSAHWEEAQPTLTAAAQPSLFYDYYGFPPESYSIKYPCYGNPSLAKEIQSVFNKAGNNAKLDAQRGFDHGMFIPLSIMYPDADIPCVQLSLLHHLDAAAHVDMGAVLQNLTVVETEHLLVIGSGFSFHNMSEFFSTNKSTSASKNQAFEDWLIETCNSKHLSEAERRQRLIDWQKAPFARFCHPREEHLLPLHVCYGLAQTACSAHYALNILNVKSSMYLWQ